MHIKFHKNEDRASDYREVLRYADAIYDKYFEMAGKERRFSDNNWPEQRRGVKYGKESSHQIWVKMPEGARVPANGGDDAMFHATPRDRSVLISVSPLEPYSGRYVPSFKKSYTLEQLQRIGAPEEAASLIYSAYPFDTILLPV